MEIGGAAFTVDLAITQEERSQGLSGRPSLDAGMGMLFVFEEPALLRFWMRDMNFPLDMVWIGSDCTVVDVTQNAPVPPEDQAAYQLPLYSPRSPAQYVLELNAGEAGARGIGLGSVVRFTGSLTGEHGC